MRMRTKKWARPELEVCPFYLKAPQDNKGKWKYAYKKQQPLWLELGCGKGYFLAQIASENQDKNFLAIDLSSDMLGLTKRNIEKMYAEKKLPTENVMITWQNIERIKNIIDGDIFERIYINFCNPWHKPSQYKKRLTHPRQLMNYREFLQNDGEIWFKTDDDGLFNHSLGYFEECGFEIIYKTYDLHESGFEPNYITEHEEMYTKEGIKIKFLIAKKVKLVVSESNVELQKEC
ncbi:tRNA (guanosine(46)-N7)-methyltransferase TrmB [Paludicola sp. MB14-C6]|uniref:tRNA (guanosine(46)-N7)-methyltransferase TrmB n=1 Tax=Paludihabitans sp. MB14-C6 TaxID=3070656 RepID=UPI0027DAF95E|nr:tRNA (guanosine(46)-N7)-methyltransferase TrmB [Paludicola sp. MB14-C6]WMJ22280.1 tRNA (guanosine(46)-N7)-methyltransferase TrmB [Paludicola sp. MB14-C6]